MHPFGFFLAILAAGSDRRHEARRPVPDEPLPPIDDATVRAWRAWAASDRTTSPVDARHLPTPSSTRRNAGTRADRPA